MIRNDTTQKCLDSNTANNPLVEPGYCDQANTRQNWYLQPSDGGGGYYLIRNVNTGKCRDVFGGAATTARRSVSPAQAHDRSITDGSLSRGGYRIHTTFDRKPTAELAGAVARVGAQRLDPAHRSADRNVQVGAASAEPTTGRIVAMSAIGWCRCMRGSSGG
ncbi:RICIN domain-containing protein [Streptomyces noursei]|nr:RICIN domain-containing protein [Streptomyces noursei]